MNNFESDLGSEEEPESVTTLLAAHLTLIGERLKDTSRNIESHIQNGDNPCIDRSLDTLLDTILYVSNVLLFLFNSVSEGLENQESENEIEKQLTNLGVFHLTSAQIGILGARQQQQQQPQSQPAPQQQVQQVQQQPVQQQQQQQQTNFIQQPQYRN